ncbi:radical SAM protein [Micromonospora sp. NPDC023956]|uniref:B12-binding domain-containing radical SAM protein n=1 Tax=Micromonospora sp. NPDC023956 TaxID=3155722 RepID=UPI0033D6BBF0
MAHSRSAQIPLGPPIPHGGYDPLRHHTAPGVLAVEPTVGPAAADLLAAAAVVELIRPYHGVLVHGDMNGDLGIAVSGGAPRPDLTMVSVAAALEAAGRTVRVRDENAHAGPAPAAARPPDLRMVKMQLATWRDDVRYVEQLRAAEPDVPVLMFGAVVTYLPGIDPGLAVRGDATRAVSDVLGSERLLVGAAYRLFPVDLYCDERGRPLLHLQASRGCDRTCRYCPYIRIHGRWSGRRLDELADDIRRLDDLGVHRIQFRDQDFPSDPGHAIEAAHVVAEASQNRMRWAVEGNLDRFTAPVLEALRTGGCDEIIIGIESTDPKVLRAARRRTLADLAERISAVVESGLNVRGLFIVGLPEDDWERLAATVRDALDLPLHAAHFSVYSPLPGESFGTRDTVRVEDIEPHVNFYRYPTCEAMTESEVRLAASLADRVFIAHRAGDPSWRELLAQITRAAAHSSTLRAARPAP